MKGRARIFRYNPLVDRTPYFQVFDYEYSPGMTVLDVLHLIREREDATLQYSYCCRNGHCGLCGVRVNGREVLSCKQAAEEFLEIAPLRNIRVMKDLVIDREEYERNRPRLRLFLERQCDAEPSEPERIDMEAFELFKTASRCIECLCCVSVCPAFMQKPHLFAGPMAFALLARHFFDPRDGMDRSLVAHDEGIGCCLDCSLCSAVCRQNVDPGRLIGLMKGK